MAFGYEQDAARASPQKAQSASARVRVQAAAKGSPWADARKVWFLGERGLRAFRGDWGVCVCCGGLEPLVLHRRSAGPRRPFVYFPFFFLPSCGGFFPLIVEKMIVQISPRGMWILLPPAFPLPSHFKKHNSEDPPGYPGLGEAGVACFPGPWQNRLGSLWGSRRHRNPV